MSILKELFQNNKNWSESIRKSDPQYFERLARQQKPEYLWIGCSDSRVLSNETLGLKHGQLFVHRNIANQVNSHDFNVMSVMQYAVEMLRVKHIIVCGHYCCGGVQAAMSGQKLGLIDEWLEPLKNIYESNKTRIESLQDKNKQLNLLCELNVIQQTVNICRTHTVRNAWKFGQNLSVHGLIYCMEDGIIKDLNVCMKCENDLENTEKTHQTIYQMEV